MSETTAQVKTNRAVEDFILSSKSLYANREWILDQWQKYANEVAMAQGDRHLVVDMIKARRKAQEPKIIRSSSGAENGVVNLDDEAYYSKKSWYDNQKIPANSIAHLTLSGVMRAQGGMSTRGVNELIEDLNYAFNHPNIIGILLEVNSGGGEATAGLMLKSALENAPKPVVVHAHFIASAAVMGTLTADEIVLSGNTAEMGSIGTMITLRKGFAERYKEVYQDMYAGKSKNKNKSFRAFLEGNLQVMQDDLDAFNEEFLNDVKKHRELKGDIDETLSGEMFTAKVAKRKGLAHGIGGREYALKRLNAHIKLKNS